MSFDRLPFAAASIGQVHSAVLSAKASPSGKEAPVAVKIQFPNIINSIDSDLGYVRLLLTAGRLLPKGLFLDRTIEVCPSCYITSGMCDILLGAFFYYFYLVCKGNEVRTGGRVRLYS